MRPTDKNARPAAGEPDFARSEAENLLGDFRALLLQVGLPGVAFDKSALRGGADFKAPATVAQFLENYATRLLFPCELPAIVAACGLARRGQWRDLLAQDQLLSVHLVSTPFADPSRRIGQLQLARLRPLRDDRIVQRYLTAVESGLAHGWNTVVFGLTLAVFSMPLRQGLLYYSRETLSALATAAGRSNGASDLEIGETLSALLARVPAAVENALATAQCGDLLFKTQTSP